MRRPWKVRAYDLNYNEYTGASFTTRDRALIRARTMLAEGYLDVQLYVQDSRGYVLGQIERLKA